MKIKDKKIILIMFIVNFISSCQIGYDLGLVGTWESNENMVTHTFVFSIDDTFTHTLDGKKREGKIKSVKNDALFKIVVLKYNDDDNEYNYIYNLSYNTLKLGEIQFTKKN